MKFAGTQSFRQVCVPPRTKQEIAADNRDKLVERVLERRGIPIRLFNQIIRAYSDEITR